MSVTIGPYSQEQFAQDMAQRFESGDVVNQFLDSPFYVRPDSRDDQPFYVQGDTQYHPPKFEVTHDYVTAASYVDFFDSFVEGNMAAMPLIPPFASAPEKNYNHHQLISEDEARIVETLKLRVPAEIAFSLPGDLRDNEQGRPYLRWGSKRLALECDEDDRLEIVADDYDLDDDESQDENRAESASEHLNYDQGPGRDVLGYGTDFVSEEPVIRRPGVGMIFNPFTLQGARLVNSIRSTKKGYTGLYTLNKRSYRFVWFYDTKHYIVNSDLWSKRVKPKYNDMLCFSLICKEPFWDFSYESSVNSFPMVGSIITNGLIFPYDISNGLGRVDAKGGFVMNYGSTQIIEKIRAKRVVPVQFVGSASFYPCPGGPWICVNKRKGGPDEKKYKIYEKGTKPVKFQTTYDVTVGNDFRIFDFRGSHFAVPVIKGRMYGVIETVESVLRVVADSDNGDDVSHYENNPLTFSSWRQARKRKKKMKKNAQLTSEINNGVRIESDFGLIDVVHGVFDMSVATFIKVWLSTVEPNRSVGVAGEEIIIPGERDPLDSYMDFDEVDPA